MLEYIVSGVLTAMIPVVGYLVNKVFDTDKRVAAHEVRFSSFESNITDFKNEQRDQTQKLDRLIEGNLRDATQANINHATELRVAAASALVIVEKAKDSALAVVAEAARVAKSINPIVP